MYVRTYILVYTIYTYIHTCTYSLLAVGGGNCRTANVKSKGFTSVFVLSKNDVQQTLVDYPDAQETLRKRGK